MHLNQQQAFQPIGKFYLPFLQGFGDELKKKEALFRYYMNLELWQAAHGVLASMGEAAPEAWWQEWREAF